MNNLLLRLLFDAILQGNAVEVNGKLEILLFKDGKIGDKKGTFDFHSIKCTVSCDEIKIKTKYLKQ